jgi:hypothetical protein
VPIEMTLCAQCGWGYGKISGMRHDCKFTQAKRTVIHAKNYLLKTYPDDDSIFDAWGVLDNAHLNVIRAENEMEVE